MAEAAKIIVGILVGAAIVLLGCAAFWLVTSAVSVEVLLVLITSISGFFLAMYQYRKVKQNEVDGRLFPEKAKVYREIIELIYDLFKAQKGWIDTKTEDQLSSELLDLRSSLIIWGSVESYTALEEFGSAPQSGLTNEQMSAILVTRMAKLFEAIRKDLGHRDPPGQGLKMALQVLTEADRARAAEHL